mmetsp:Transcript_16091/g.27176  ORF Transcript_16091/g.27176 Transcript_16091/m.27176 type:complete len:116 (+) Transcript_16091:1497-1844(+)
MDADSDTGASNYRKICVMQLNTKASFEVIHGVLCLLMTKIDAKMGKDFCLKEHAPDQDRMFFGQRGADVMLAGKRVGSIGVLHPEVLDNFQLKNPVSAFELDFEPIWQFFKASHN